MVIEPAQELTRFQDLGARNGIEHGKEAVLLGTVVARIINGTDVDCSNNQAGFNDHLFSGRCCHDVCTDGKPKRNNDQNGQ